MYSALSSEAETQHMMVLGMALSKVGFFLTKIYFYAPAFVHFTWGNYFTPDYL